ncbi:MAG: desulfoferrodoxin [Oscillospiraceae bacterium]|nr:desulfoferrodoxin [Oscillospiraceae bacterium]
MKFYKCKACGSILIQDAGADCCGAELEELIPNTTDAAGEKHVPVIAVDGAVVTVTVGAVEHPMLPAHFIQWIVLETSAGYQKKVLKPETKPCAQFVLAEGETAVAAYEFCNLHGLWKAEV